MKKRHRFPPSVTVFLLLLSTAARADDTAQAWLTRISRAAATLSYEGTFIYQHDTQLDTLRIIHQVDDGKVRERMVSLTGPAREIVRTDNEVRCFLPDEKSVVVEQRGEGSGGFPSILPERPQDLEASYTMQTGRSGRVTGRPVQEIVVQPKDNYRYGYQLWADIDTGLLLRADLLDADGHMIERFMFTRVSIGGPISAAALQPESAGDGLVWYRNPAAAANTQMPWIATRLPPGFRLSAQMTRQTAPDREPTDHLVFTDGLATVSVFIDKQQPNAEVTTVGTNRMGAVHAFGTQVDDYQVTAVGEVPAATVALIGGSISRKP
jgi:sigma-E factor negative regulatory protein RseB